MEGVVCGNVYSVYGVYGVYDAYGVYGVHCICNIYIVYRSLPPVVWGGWTGEPTPYPPIPLAGGAAIIDHGIYIYIYVLFHSVSGSSYCSAFLMITCLNKGEVDDFPATW